MQAGKQTWWWHPATRWTALVVFLAGWTAALVYPRPSELAGVELSSDATFLMAKAVHVSAYALLAVLTAALPLRRPGRCWLLLLLAVHAAATEALQLLVPPRSGALFDVGLNLFGLGIGMALSGRRWLRD